MATRTVANGGGNYNAVGTWVEGAVPTSADDVVFTGTSGQLTVNVSSAAKTFDCTNYTGTLTMNHTLTVSGSVTLVSAMTITTSSGTPLLTINATGTMTSNTKTWPYAVTFSTGVGTQTLADNWDINGLITIGAALTINGNTINAAAGWAHTTASNCTGTTAVVLDGTGTLSTSSTGFTGLTFTINLAGTLTISGTFRFAGTLNYTAGTVAASTATFVPSGNCTINFAITFSQVTPGAASTVTLGGDMTIVNNFTHTSTGGAQTWNGAFNINIQGGMSMSSGRTLAGTATVVMTGTGTVTITGLVQNNFTINTSGTITFGATFTYNGGTLTYTSGTVDCTTNSNQLVVAASTTFNTSGMTWLDIFFQTGAGQTATINSTLTASGTITSSVSMSFLGTAGFTCLNYTCVTSGRTITLKNGNTYTVTGLLTMTGTLASPVAFASSSGSLTAALVLQQGGTQDLDFCDATRIDSSAGLTIVSYKGTLTTTTNWREMPTQPGQFSYGLE